jgi:exopolyphosphatase / guanosine-5'-triphosphate,3'-diphosphate pyrophosphatase
VAGCAQRLPILGWASFPVGVVTLSESFVDDAPGWYARMVDHVADRLAQHDAAARFGPLFAAGRGRLVGNSGTVTCLAAVQMGLERYSRQVVDGAWLRPDEVVSVRRSLHDSTLEQRAAQPCIGPERAGLILGGCAILEAVWRMWPSDRLRVGDRGLREGIILSMVHRQPAKGDKRPEGQNRASPRRGRTHGAPQ